MAKNPYEGPKASEECPQPRQQSYPILRGVFLYAISCWLLQQTVGPLLAPRLPPDRGAPDWIGFGAFIFCYGLPLLVVYFDSRR